MEVKESTGREAEKRKKRQRRFLLLGVAALLFIFVRYGWGGGGGSVSLGLAILACCGFLWLTEALPLAITALFIPVLAVFTGVLDAKEALGGFSHPLIYLFLGGFGIAATLSRQGIDRWMAHRLIMLAGGSFFYSATALCVASAAVSMWISNTATTAMLLPVALGMIRELAETRTKEEVRNASCYLLFGIAFGSSIGGMGTVIGTPPNAIAALALDLDFASWMKLAVPAVLILLPLCLIILRWLYPVDRKVRLSVADIDFTWNRERRATLVIFLLTAAAWLSSGQISDLLGGVKYLDTMIALAAVVAYSATGLVRWKDIDRTTDWGVLLLFGGGLTLSAILDGDKTGGSAFLAQSLASMTEGWPALLIIGAVVLLVIFLTELTSNTATTFLFVPLFMALAGPMGLEPEKLVIPVALAASCAFMLPVATPPNAIVYGSGMVTQKEMIRAGLRLNFLLGAVLVAYSVLFL